MSINNILIHLHLMAYFDRETRLASLENYNFHDLTMSNDQTSKVHMQIATMNKKHLSHVPHVVNSQKFITLQILIRIYNHYDYHKYSA